MGYLANIRRKTITVFRQGFDVILAFCRKCFSQVRNVLGKIILLNKSILPDGLEHFFLAQGPAVVFDEQQQSLEFLRRKTDRLAFRKQSFITRVENKPSEFVDKPLI